VVSLNGLELAVHNWISLGNAFVMNAGRGVFGERFVGGEVLLGIGMGA
jgi:hypothetical protein